MNAFSDLSLSSALRVNLDRHLFTTPTPVQAGAIPPALEGRDVVATAQTGTGKTLAFLLPILETLLREPGKPGVATVILSPTRELAQQIDETFQKLAAGTTLRSAVVVGGLNEQRQLLAIRKGAQVIIATPGRLCDFLERRLVKLGSTRILILDEADRMLDMGFLPALEQILAPMPEERQTLFFSATIEKSVAHLIGKYLKDPVRVAVGSTTKPAEQVDLHSYEVEQDRKLGLLHHLLECEQGAFLVFARTKHGADRLARKLASTGVRSASIHGDRTQNQRNQALRSFQKGDCRVLVATDVASRGIHVDGIAHVVNYDLPQAPEDFIHRVGRTGRAGARGVASTFATRAERSEIRRIERALNLRLTPRNVSSDVQSEQRMTPPKHVAKHHEQPEETHVREEMGPVAQSEPSSSAPKNRPAGDKPRKERTSASQSKKARPSSFEPWSETPGEKPAKDKSAAAQPRKEFSSNFQPKENGSFGGKKSKNRSFGPEPRHERPFGAKSWKDQSAAQPRKENASGFQPREDRPFGGKPRKDRPFGFEPRHERPFGAKPWKDQSAAQPRKEHASGFQPREARPFGSKPRKDRPFGFEPRHDRPFGAKPWEERGAAQPRNERASGFQPREKGTFSGKPGKDRSFGASKPAGRSFESPARTERPSGKPTKSAQFKQRKPFGR